MRFQKCIHSQIMIWLLIGIGFFACTDNEPVLPDINGVKPVVIDENVQFTIFVRQNGGDDKNSGLTFDEALKTITKAAAKAAESVRSGKSTKILIHPGTYRETLERIDCGENSEAALIIEGTEPESVILSGSDVFTNWKKLGNTGIYEHDWPYDFGNSYVAYPTKLIAHRCEMVFVNRAPLKQVILEEYEYDEETKEFKSYTGFRKPWEVLNPGTFGIAERDENGNKIYIYPASDIDFSQALVEISVRNSLAEIEKKANLALRNLTVQHYCNQLSQPWSGTQTIQLPDGLENVLLERCVIQWNNGHGLRLGKLKNVTIKNSGFNYNGFAGMNVGGTENLYMENCESNFNCWRGYSAGDYYFTGVGSGAAWFSGGIKFHNLNRHILKNHVACGNLVGGIWYDVHNKNVLVEDLISVFNYGNGLFMEISYGPFQVIRSLLACNANEYQCVTTGAVTSENLICFHGGPMLMDEQERRGAANYNWAARPGNAHWEMDPFHPVQHRAVNNIYLGAEHKKQMFVFRENNAEKFKDSYLGEGNLFYLFGSAAGKFRFGEGKLMQTGSFQDYIAWMGSEKEKNATWQDPGFRDPENLDFRLKDDSPLKPRKAYYKTVKVDPELIREKDAFFKWVDFDYDRHK